MAKIRKVLISVSDKTGVAEFARELAKFDCEFLSTGGTATMLRNEGLNVTDVSEYTGFPEMMDGRVKTLHPKIHGALLAIRNNPDHVAAMRKHSIIPIDMVVVNLYPFKKTIEKPGCTFEDAIENIDIGGPSMLRSSAKNHESVTVLTDSADYAFIVEEMKTSGGCVSTKTNRRLAQKVYALTSSYDAMIAEYLGKNLDA